MKTCTGAAARARAQAETSAGRTQSHRRRRQGRVESWRAGRDGDLDAAGRERVAEVVSKLPQLHDEAAARRKQLRDGRRERRHLPCIRGERSGGGRRGVARGCVLGGAHVLRKGVAKLAGMARFDIRLRNLRAVAAAAVVCPAPTRT